MGSNICGEIAVSRERNIITIGEGVKQNRAICLLLHDLGSRDGITVVHDVVNEDRGSKEKHALLFGTAFGENEFVRVFVGNAATGLSELQDLSVIPTQ